MEIKKIAGNNKDNTIGPEKDPVLGTGEFSNCEKQLGHKTGVSFTSNAWTGEVSGRTLNERKLEKTIEKLEIDNDELLGALEQQSELYEGLKEDAEGLKEFLQKEVAPMFVIDEFGPVKNSLDVNDPNEILHEWKELTEDLIVNSADLEKKLVQCEEKLKVKDGQVNELEKKLAAKEEELEREQNISTENLVTHFRGEMQSKEERNAMEGAIKMASRWNYTFILGILIATMIYIIKQRKK